MNIDITNYAEEHHISTERLIKMVYDSMPELEKRKYDTIPEAVENYFPRWLDLLED